MNRRRDGLPAPFVAAMEHRVERRRVAASPDGADLEWAHEERSEDALGDTVVANELLLDREPCFLEHLSMLVERDRPFIAGDAGDACAQPPQSFGIDGHVGASRARFARVPNEANRVPES